MTRCKICDDRAELYDVVDFGKTCDTLNVYPRGLHGTPIYYYRCQACGFIFTRHFDNYDQAQWKREVYNDDYGNVDPEYDRIRPHRNARFLELLLSGHRDSVIGLDYGGGNGLTAQLLRQRGWNFDCHDPFGTTELQASRSRTYTLITAFEVFEHLTDPTSTLSSIVQKMTDGSPLIIIGTGASDGKVNNVTRLNWWYAAPRNGHVSLYSKRSLAVLAQRFGLKCISLSGGFHFMSRQQLQRAIIARFPFALLSVRAADRLASVLTGHHPEIRRSAVQLGIRHVGH